MISLDEALELVLGVVDQDIARLEQGVLTVDNLPDYLRELRTRLSDELVRGAIGPDEED